MTFAVFYKFLADNQTISPMLGSDGVCILDGRLGIDNLKILATKTAKQRLKSKYIVAYSIHKGPRFDTSSVIVEPTPIKDETWTSINPW